MKGPSLPLILLLAALACGSLQAQQGGVTILRGEGADQTRPGTPDTGVRRVPSGSGTVAPRPPQPAPTNGPRSSQLPIANEGGVAPAAPTSDMAQSLADINCPSCGSNFSLIDEQSATVVDDLRVEECICCARCVALSCQITRDGDAGVVF